MRAELAVIKIETCAPGGLVMPGFFCCFQAANGLQATGRLHGYQQQEPKMLLPRQHCLT